MALDDMISDNKTLGRAPGARRGTARTAGSRTATRTENSRTNRSDARRRTTPYARQSASDADHIRGADVRDVAASQNPVLKVGHGSQAKNVAGAICNVIRENVHDVAPCILATGPAAINQAMKAIAIARKYLQNEPKPVDLLVRARFEQQIREGSNIVFELFKTKSIDRMPSEDDLAAKEKTDVNKLAGAIANRIRDGEEVAVTTKGPVPVLVAVKSIGMAEVYLAEDNISLQYSVGIVDLENPEISNETSTYLHFALFPIAA